MNSVKDLIESLFGSYVPVSYESYLELSDGTVQSVEVIPGGFAGVDWGWISGVLLFAISLYCIFKIIGGLLKNA